MRQSEIPIFAYVDETGNTGANIFDQQQPDFYTAALITKGDIDETCQPRITALAKALGEDALHAQKLGIAGIEKISGDFLNLLKRINAHFFVSRVEKKYLLATKVFDSIFDSGENAAVAWHHYNLRPLRIILAFKVAHIIDTETAHLFWDCLMMPSEKRASELLPKVCRSLMRHIERLPDEKSRTIIREALDWAERNPDSIQIHTDRKLVRHGHLPNLVAFVNLLDGLQQYSTLWNRPVARIIHDQQEEFEKALSLSHDMFSRASPEPTRWIDETYVIQKVPGSQFETKRDCESAGIQIADVVLWLQAQAARGKSLPAGCSSLMNYIADHALIHDFSFAGVEARILQDYGNVLFGEITAEQEAAAAKLVGEAEIRRKASIQQYENDRVPPFQRT